MSRCPFCPWERAGRPAPCPGESNPAACRDAAARANPPPDPAADATIPLAATLAALALVKRCRHRTERADCGCGGIATCALGKGRDGLVNLADCTSCVAGPG